MSATVTVIADKDIGSVLGAVTETSADEALKLEQVVAEAGFPLREGSAVTLEVPRIELTTAAATSLGAVSDPQSYLVKDGVPTSVGTGMTVSDLVLTAAQIEIFFTTPPAGEVKAKAILHNRDDDTVEVFPATKRQPSATNTITIGASLQPLGSYDALILVEGYRAYFEEQVGVT